MRHSCRTRPKGRWRQAWRYSSMPKSHSTPWTVFAYSPSAHRPRWRQHHTRLRQRFRARLVQRGPFRLIKTLPYEVKSDSEALWYARNEGCELAMVPSIALPDGWNGGHAHKACSPHPDTGRTHVCSPLGHQTERVLRAGSRCRPCLDYVRWRPRPEVQRDGRLSGATVCRISWFSLSS